MQYQKTITITSGEAQTINHYLHDEPKDKSECLSEDEVIVHTAVFDNGIEIDIKCCGVQYDENEDTNTAWTEAVLFVNDCERCCGYGEDEYIGEWQLEYDGDIYEVNVIVSD